MGLDKKLSQLIDCPLSTNYYHRDVTCSRRDQGEQIPHLALHYDHSLACSTL